MGSVWHRRDRLCFLFHLVTTVHVNHDKRLAAFALDGHRQSRSDVVVFGRAKKPNGQLVNPYQKSIATFYVQLLNMSQRIASNERQFDASI